MAGSKRSHNQIRIIGGDWRGRKISFSDAQGLRPTPDRVRETLFNWLQGYLPGAACLDLFAGSGVLGFEALSRGASTVIAVEKNPQVFNSLKQNSDALNAADRLQLRNADALQVIEALAPYSLDLVFIDPPYGKGMVAKCLQQLANGSSLKPGALIYVEQESQMESPDLPENWVILKDKQASQVSCYLVRANARDDL